jgi:hypothetical protein
MECLFCRRDDGGFIAREHALPESLGNSELILPPGVVCDRCNNGTLSDLDQMLCDFMPIKARRTVLGISSKSGKIPQLRVTEGSAEHLPGQDGADPTLVLTSSTRRQMLRETGRHPDGRVSLEWTFSGGRRMSPQYAAQLSRALLKAALECAWLDHGAATLDARFDHVRAAVLGEPRAGFFSMLTKADPDNTKVALTYLLDPDGADPGRILVGLDYAGVVVGTDSRLAQPLGDERMLAAFSVIAFTERAFGKG